MANEKALKIVKLVVPMATFGLGLVSTWLSNKDLDDKIAKKTAEALANSVKEEA